MRNRRFDEVNPTFSYEPTNRRLRNHVLEGVTSGRLLGAVYVFDYVGNITGITNNDMTTDNGFGGNYFYNYEYDTLNRLTGASGNAEPGRKEGGGPLNPAVGSITSTFETSLTYTPSSGIKTKQQNHYQDGQVNENNTYNKVYEYIGGTHQVGHVINQSTGVDEYFEYDANGNAVYYASSDGQITDKFFWDEQDRLRAVRREPQSVYQYYVYDDKGERTIKANLYDDAQLYQNGVLVDSGLMFKDYKVYPNPYVVLDSEGILTKHYFAGEQRVASRLKEGGGTFYQKPAAPRSTGTDPGTKEGRPDVEADFKTYLEKAGFKNAEVQKEFARSASFEYGVYYLHGDHLGTATMVTNWDGTPTQFFLNLPFGETMAEQQEQSAYPNPYKFNAKELDKEMRSIRELH